MISNFPKCAVLMATHNGEPWLADQLDSLFTQQFVELQIIVSDDQSSDGTLQILSNRVSSLSITILPKLSNPFGSANRNFMRLIRDSDIGEADYIALADQDDIWREDKLKRSIERLQVEESSAYSSDFEAFWPDGRNLIVKKSFPQREFDHLFGSPGPGCTFVFKRSLFLEIRAWVISNFDVLSSLWVHDWILYAYTRTHGHRWFIDSMPTLRYRQHNSNEIGVNFGFKAMLRRLAIVKQGRYRHDIVIIAELTGANPECVRALRRLNWFDRFWLIRHAGKFRRSFTEVVALCLIFALMPVKPIAAIE